MHQRPAYPRLALLPCMAANDLVLEVVSSRVPAVQNVVHLGDVACQHDWCHLAQQRHVTDIESVVEKAVMMNNVTQTCGPCLLHFPCHPLPMLCIAC